MNGGVGRPEASGGDDSRKSKVYKVLKVREVANSRLYGLLTFDFTDFVYPHVQA